MIRLGQQLVRLSFTRVSMACAHFRQKKDRTEYDEDDQNDMLSNLKYSYDQLERNIRENGEDSILNMFNDAGKKKAQEEETPQSEDSIVDYINAMKLSLELYMSNLSPEEQLKRSQDIQKMEMLGKDWGVSPRPALNQDYQDYSLFNKNLMKIKRTDQSILDQDPNYNNKTNLKFLSNLHENVKDRSSQEGIYSYLYKNPKVIQTEINKSEEQPVDQMDFDQQLGYPHLIDNEWELEDSEDVQDEPDTKNTRLSVRAKFQIFDLFNQGWSVRDLSNRFGILPMRVKAIVYQKRYFFDEVFPNISLELLRDLANYEKSYEKFYGTVDYGVDLDQMTKKDHGHLQTNFNNANRNVDIKALGAKEQERLKKLFEEKKTRKYDMVTEKFIGEQNKGYFIKSWLMYKTKSKPGVSQLFERIVRNSDKPYRLPKNVQKRLSLGPRAAAMKRGH